LSELDEVRDQILTELAATVSKREEGS